jgi:CubicO group peptidase (beta-lactamase class C family)
MCRSLRASRQIKVAIPCLWLEALLNMRSGLYNYTDAPEISASLDHDPAKVWTPQEVLSIASKYPPYFPPGTAFHYSNTNYALLGLIAEERERGKPLARIFQDRLFRPLGMHDTALPASTSNTLPDPYSHGYLYGSSSGGFRPCYQTSSHSRRTACFALSSAGVPSNTIRPWPIT